MSLSLNVHLMLYGVQSDTLHIRIMIDSNPYTRRGVLSIVSSIVDRLDLLGS